MKVFESELRGKRVMSDDGGYLGVLRNVTANVHTGDLVNIHVEPEPEIDPRLYPQDSQGRILFAFDAIRSVRDVIIVAAS